MVQSIYGRLSSCVKPTAGTTSYFPCLVRFPDESCILPFSPFNNNLSTLLNQNFGTGILITNDTPNILKLMYADKLQQKLDLKLLINFVRNKHTDTYRICHEFTVEIKFY